MADVSKDFRATFDPEKQSIENELANLDKVPVGERQQKIDSLVQRIHALEKSITANIGVISPFDARVCLEAVSSLSTTLSQLRVQLIPKPKFTFKSRKAISPSTLAVSESVSAKDSSKSQTSHVDESMFMKFENRTNEHLYIGTLLQQQQQQQSNSMEEVYLGGLPVTTENKALNADSSAAETTEEQKPKDVALTNLTDCTINLLHDNTPLGAIHIRNLKRCTLVIPPVSGSILLHDCEGCVLIGACHQSRMHTSTDMDIYLHVTSEPIIEDCTNMRFAPYPYHDLFPTSVAPVHDIGATAATTFSPESGDPRLNRLFELAKLNPQVNYFDRVKDFNWLRQQKSPNWRVVDSSEIKEGVAPLVLIKDELAEHQLQQQLRQQQQGLRLKRFPVVAV